MTAVIFYSALALLLIWLTAWLVRHRRENAVTTRAGDQEDYVQGLWDSRSLNLAERLFDSTDHRWLRDEVGRPELAIVLARARQLMALRWLRALRRSFDELVRFSEPEAGERDSREAPENWQSLWLVLRFQCLLLYALLVVRLFGPYHRLIPSADWLQSLPGFAKAQASSRAADLKDTL